MSIPTFTELCISGCALVIISLSSPIMAASPACEHASDLNDQAYKLHEQGASKAKLKRLLNQALQSCPSHPQAHNNLADILTEEGKYSQAINHYRQALRVQRDFAEAWYGLGEVYYKMGQFPRSLEAHLHACKTDEDSQARLKKLLKDNHYAVNDANKILDKESLLLLFDERRRQEIERKLKACGLKAKLQHVIAFRNLRFHPSSAKLEPLSLRQLKKLAGVLKLVEPDTIEVSGHTDNQRWRGLSKRKSDRRNLDLSKQRAQAVKKELVKQGVSKRRIQAHGYGSTRPLLEEKSQSALAKNRRVEVEAK